MLVLIALYLYLNLKYLNVFIDITPYNDITFVRIVIDNTGKKVCSGVFPSLHQLSKFAYVEVLLSVFYGMNHLFLSQCCWVAGMKNTNTILGLTTKESSQLLLQKKYKLRIICEFLLINLFSYIQLLVKIVKITTAKKKCKLAIYDCLIT